jgi:hypothetical protein
VAVAVLGFVGGISSAMPAIAGAFVIGFVGATLVNVLSDPR